jgi:hypothetical protein
LIWRRGAGAAAELFVTHLDNVNDQWELFGTALNAPLQAPKDALAFFDLMFEADGTPLAVWSEGVAPHDVLASRYDGSAWQAMPKIVDNEGSYAITGLSAARGVFADSPPQVMAARHTNQGFGDLWMLQNGQWQSRPVLIAPGPMFGLTMQIALQATPVVAWVGEVGAPGSGQFQVFVWRSQF